MLVGGDTHKQGSPILALYLLVKWWLYFGSSQLVNIGLNRKPDA